MRLAASAVPAPAPPTIARRVHSVFRRTINLSDDAGGLLTLYAGTGSTAPPGAIVVSAPAGFDFSAHVAPGVAAACRGGVLRIDRSELSVDLRPARAVGEDADVHAVHTDIAPAWRIVWRRLTDDGSRSGFAAAFTGTPPSRTLDAALAARLRRALPPLLAALPAADCAAATAAALPLIGAGYGLTPSGDDFLAGFIFGAQRSAKDAAQRALVADLAHRLTTATAASGDISRTYLAHAADGRMAPPLAGLAGAIIAEADASALARAAADAVAIGHSSGADAALGLLCGLAAWRDDLATTVLAAVRQPRQAGAEARR